LALTLKRRSTFFDIAHWPIVSATHSQTQQGSCCLAESRLVFIGLLTSLHPASEQHLGAFYYLKHVQRFQIADIILLVSISS